jgi:hypothetical protein
MQRYIRHDITTWQKMPGQVTAGSGRGCTPVLRQKIKNRPGGRSCGDCGAVSAHVVAHVFAYVKDHEGGKADNPGAKSGTHQRKFSHVDTWLIEGG